MKREKGQYGYRDSIWRTRLAVTAVLAAAVLAQLGARYLTDDQAAKNILTVMAILTVLPLANMASPLLASWPYRTPPKDFYEKIKPYEEKCIILYDLILTTKEFVIPLDAIAVHPGGVYGYCTAKKLKVKEAEQSLNKLFTAGGLDPKMKLIPEEKSFLRRMDSLKPAGEGKEDGMAEAAVSLLKSLAM